MQGLHTLSGSDTESRFMLRRGLTATAKRQTRLRTSTANQQDCACPRPIPAHQRPWIKVPVLWYCGRRRSGWPRAPVLAIGLRSSGIKKECPEIDGRASCRLGILVLPAGWLVAPPSLPVRQRECVAAVSQCPPVSGLPGWGEGERKRAAAAAGHP